MANNFTKPTLAGSDLFTQLGRLVDTVEGVMTGRNRIRNGDFQIAQRGTSIAGMTTAQVTLDGVTYPAGANTGTTTHSQQAFTVGQTAVPGNPRNFLRVVRTVAATVDNVLAEFRIEHPDLYAGLNITVGFNALVSTGTKALVFDVQSGGVTTAFDTSDTAAALTTTWQPFKATVSIPSSITAVTVDAYVALRIREAASFGTFTVDIADVTFEIGNECSKFPRLSYMEQLRWCQRFFCKSFVIATAPAQNIGVDVSEQVFPAMRAGAAGEYGGNVIFPVSMRKAPALTYYNPSAANIQIRDRDAAADCSSSAAGVITDRGFYPITTGNASTAVGNRLVFNWSATAEL